MSSLGLGNALALSVPDVVVPAADPEEAGGLFEGPGPQAPHRQQAGSPEKDPVALPVGHDLLGQGGADAGDPGQQGRAGGVEVDADGADAALHHGVEGLLQGGLVHVVLVLGPHRWTGDPPSPARRGDPAGDGRWRWPPAPSGRDRELLAGQVRRRIDAGPPTHSPASRWVSSTRGSPGRRPRSLDRRCRCRRRWPRAGGSAPGVAAAPGPRRGLFAPGLERSWRPRGSDRCRRRRRTCSRCGSRDRCRRRWRPPGVVPATRRAGSRRRP